jgi:hypothetical protein
MQTQNGETRSLTRFEVGYQLGPGGICNFVFREEAWMVGWGVARGEGRFGKSVEVENEFIRTLFSRAVDKGYSK